MQVFNNRIRNLFGKETLKEQYIYLMILLIKELTLLKFIKAL